MGIKDKLTSIIIEKAKEQFEENTDINNSFNKMMDKIGKFAGQKSADEYIKQSKGNCLIVKTKSISAKTMLNVAKNIIKDNNIDIDDDVEFNTKIVDEENNLKYITNLGSSDILMLDEATLYDKTGNKIAFVKEKLLKLHLPFLEKNVKSCNLFIKDKKVCEIRVSEIFKEKSFEISEDDNNNYEIEINDQKAYIIKGRE